MARAPIAQESEVLPEADRLGQFPHPRQTRLLFGHKRAEQALLEAFAGGRMHHAWLIAGTLGIGKATLAYRLARYALALPEERDPANLEVPAASAAARQVAALSHTGLLVLRRPYDPKAKRFATSIPVDEVRKLKTFLGLTVGESWRVVIVDAADELNPNAANALLKSLEEPPRQALFLLVVSEPSRLLPTIRSRCRRLNLHPLAPEPLRQAVDAALSASGAGSLPPDKWTVLEGLADGSVRRALLLLESGGLELHASLTRIFADLPKVDWAAAHTFADSLSTNAQEQRFDVFFELLLERLASVTRAAASGQGLPGDVSLARRLMPADRAPAWARLWQLILKEKADADALNLDRKALIMRSIAHLESACQTTP